jgi:dihydrolipoamide dehydrogenase
MHLVDTDVIIIGGGVGGYVAALKGAQLGLKITLIEKDQLGGVCLNRGCIPTKALVESAQKWEYLKNAGQFGLSTGNTSFDFTKIMQRKNRIVQGLGLGVQSLLKARKVQVIKGLADILSPEEVAVYGENKDKEVINTKDIIIATGSQVRQVKIEGLGDTKDIINTDEALSLETLPEEMVIIGGGYSGIELASIFHSFGVKVKVVDILPRILLPVDEEIASSLQKILEKKGIRFFLNREVRKIRQEDHQLSIYLKNGNEEEVIKTSKVLLSVGRVPDFGGLDIQKLGIKLENGGIYVDSYMQTNIPHIYAVGDVTGKKMLAHVASRQGQVAIDHISGNSEPMSYQVVPFCVFSNPELASVGLNEKEANGKYDNIKVFRFPYRANSRALTMNEQEGYIKMIANTQNHRILGVHIIGAHASELIAEAALALQLGVTASDIANTIHAHPSLAEIIAETAEGILGYPIHVVR